MKVYLIRHAQSQDNIRDSSIKMSVGEYNSMLGGIHATQLTSYGERQAHQLGEELKKTGIGQLYTSPYIRARSTAAILGEYLALSPQILEEAYEVHPIVLRQRDRVLPLRWHIFQS